MPPPATERELTPPVRAPADEERALHTHAVVVERDDRRRWRVAGPKAAEVLNGLVSNDIEKLAAGTGCYAAALTPKGKVIADLRIFARGEDFLVDTGALAGSGFAEVLRKYVNPRLAKYEEITDSSADIAVAGLHAVSSVATAFGLDARELDALQPHAHLPLPLAGVAALAVRTPELDLPAFDLLVAADDRARAFGLLTEAGVVPASQSTWEVKRIARGWPVWGKDMDESTLAQEAALDAWNAISYEKGCYTGQETVARVHFRGHVNRYLRRARFDGSREVPRGAALYADDKEVGDVRSSAIADNHGGVAIAMVRREVTGSAIVRARWDGTDAELRLIE